VKEVSAGVPVLPCGIHWGVESAPLNHCRLLGHLFAKFRAPVSSPGNAGVYQHVALCEELVAKCRTTMKGVEQ
jgi:hypothetical protein